MEKILALPSGKELSLSELKGLTVVEASGSPFMPDPKPYFVSLEWKQPNPLVDFWLSEEDVQAILSFLEKNGRAIER